MAALVFTFADPKNFVLTQSLFHSLSSLCVERVAPRDHDVQLRKHTKPCTWSLSCSLDFESCGYVMQEAPMSCNSSEVNDIMIYVESV